MTIYEKIKYRRKELGLTADQVADALGVSRATVYRYECSDIEKLPVNILEPLSKVLRCSPSYLMGWNDTAPTATHSLTPDKEELLANYDKLNDEGKREARKHVKLLGNSPEYTEDAEDMGNGNITA